MAECGPEEVFHQLSFSRRQKDSKPDSGLCESSTICLKRRNGDKTEGWRKMVEGTWRAESR